MRIFCCAKYSHIFSTKNNSVFVIFTFKIITKRNFEHFLAMVLNNAKSIIIIKISLFYLHENYNFNISILFTQSYKNISHNLGDNNLVWDQPTHPRLAPGL